MSCAESFIDLPIQAVTVLYLVHHDIVHPLLPLLAHFREVLKNVDGEEDEVIEIQRKVFSFSEYGTGEQSYMVLSIDLGKLCGCVLRKQLRPSREQECPDVFVAGHGLCLVEVPQEPLNGRFLAIQTVLLVCLFDDCLHVLFVENLECLRVSESEYLLAKEFYAE